MKVANFCKIFIFSTLNLICYLLSVIFITATNNIKDLESSSHYTGIAVLFSFITIGLIFYTIILLILIKKVKIDKENLNNSTSNINTENKIEIENEKNESKIIQYNIQNEDENTNPKEIKIQNYYSDREKMENSSPSTNPSLEDNPFIKEEEDPLETDNSLKFLMTLLLSSFIICQILYVVELIVLSVFHHQSLSEKITTKIYRDLIIVGYIFLFILIIFYIVLLIFYDKCGESGRKRLERLRFCKICDDCIIAGCKKCTEIFKTMTDEEFYQYIENKKKNLKGTNEQKEVYINDLQTYKNDLYDLNDLVKRHISCEDELNKLNLFPIITKKKS